jgi:hypothetical protein
MLSYGVSKVKVIYKYIIQEKVIFLTFLRKKGEGKIIFFKITEIIRLPFGKTRWRIQRMP